MKYVAQQAVLTLVNECIQHGNAPANWNYIDRIEKSFKIVGYGNLIWQNFEEFKKQKAQQRALENWQTNDNAFHTSPNPYK